MLNKMQTTERINRTIKALEKNNIDAVFVENKADIKDFVEEMLFEGCIITAGGSVSVKESGVLELIKNPKYNFLDRTREGITPDEQTEVYRQCVGADFFFCSSNAVTENGELVNVDGFSNRIASIGFGPKKVIMIVGANKIVKDVAEGFLRVKKIAAPKNCVRLGIDTPCSKLGKCVSLLKSENPAITDGCDHMGRICVNYQVAARQRIKGRIKVIICGENLGY